MANVKKDRPGMKKALQLLLRNTSAIEQKWLIRIILKVRQYQALVVAWSQTGVGGSLSSQPDFVGAGGEPGNEASTMDVFA